MRRTYAQLHRTDSHNEKGNDHHKSLYVETNSPKIVGFILTMDTGTLLITLKYLLIVMNAFVLSKSLLRFCETEIKSVKVWQNT